ncbi:MAG: lysophospholipase [Caldilineaceae bacterium]|nr:lysophospholipase [Caldilineaceae bacterium]
MMKRADHTAHRPPQLNNEHRTGESSLHAPGPALSRDVQFCPSEVETPLSIRYAQHADRSLQHSTGYLRGESGLPIFYSRWRPTGQPRGVVLILHGLGEHSGRYRHLVGALLQADYVVYAHDHQGFGRSGGARCYVQGFHDYLSGVTQVLSMARRDNPGLHFCLYGHSMGGLIGLLYMMEAPGAVDLAVIASPSLRSHDLSPVNRLLKRILELTHRVRPQLTFRQRGTLDTLSRDWEEVQIAMRDSLGVPLRSARWVVEFFETMQEVGDRANEIRLPVLMMQGLADAVVVPSATQEFFAQVGSEDKSLRLYEGYYHELHNDLGRERPIGAVLDWLNARCPEPGNS